MLRRSVGDGVSMTRSRCGITTASSCTTSVAPHPPGPVSAGNGRKIARSADSRSWQAEGSSGVAGASPGGAISAGRGRGSGISFAAATPMAAISRPIVREIRIVATGRAQMRFSAGAGAAAIMIAWQPGGSSNQMSAVDVAVIGLGAMGSAALHHLASRGQKVVGIEQFAPGHDRGSSHGDTRIIRLGYFEHPSCVPLVRAAYPLWRALERQSGQSLLQVTGIIELGAPDGTLVAGTLRSARAHGLAHEVLVAPCIMRRFPALLAPSGFIGVFQPEGGILAAEPAIHAQLG